jgi:uncharacterized protein YjeT (DUF2065 family)
MSDRMSWRSMARAITRLESTDLRGRVPLASVELGVEIVTSSWLRRPARYSSKVIALIAT